VTLSAQDARTLIDRIKVGVDAVWQLIVDAYQGRAWAALGYASWDECCTREFGTSRLRLPREERADVVASLRESGLSIRAIAAATGQSYGTIQSEVIKSDHLEPEPITGTDGKTYTSKPRPEPEPDWIDAAGDEADAKPLPPGFTAEDIAELNHPRATPPAPELPTRKRRPITDQAQAAGWELIKAVERIQRICDDDRFNVNKTKPQIAAQVETITPDLARQYLAFNTHNRNVRSYRVKGYAADMRDGRWTLNGEAIKFSADGTLLDGQHRLQAVIEADVAVQMLVVRGV
ncbi:hypothetical protein GWI33_002970, partial [Rhynchophorus ferrugineus]